MESFGKKNLKKKGNLKKKEILGKKFSAKRIEFFFKDGKSWKKNRKH